MSVWATLFAMTILGNGNGNSTSVAGAPLGDDKPTPSVIFQNVGFTGFTTSYANIRIPMNCSELDAELHRLLSTISSDAIDNATRAATQKDPKHKLQIQRLATKMKQTTPADRRIINGLIRRVETMRTTTTSLKTDGRIHHVQKRFVGLIAAAIAGAIIAATTTSVFMAAELNNLKGGVNTLMAVSTGLGKGTMSNAANMEALARIVHKNDEMISNDLRELHLSQNTDWAIQVAQQQTYMMEQVLEAVLDKRVHPLLLAQINLNATAEKVKRLAAKRGLAPMASYASDWLQHQASFVATDDGFDVYLHVPLMATDQSLILYRHLPVPVPVNNEFSVQIDSEYEYLAVSPDHRLFRAMHESDLDSCVKYGRYFACHSGNVLYKAESVKDTERAYDFSICSFALYTQDLEAALKHCKRTITPSADTIVQVSATRFVLASKTPHTGFKVCGGKRSSFHVARMSQVEIEHGCVGESKGHIFAPSDQSFSTEADRWALTFHLPTDPEVLADHLDFATLEKIRRRANSSAEQLHKMDIRHAMEQVQRELASQNFSFWNHILRAPPLAVATLALILSILALWRQRTPGAPTTNIALPQSSAPGHNYNLIAPAPHPVQPPACSPRYVEAPGCRSCQESR